METYQLGENRREIINKTQGCLLRAEVMVDPKNENTKKLLNKMNKQCPEGADKLWELSNRIAEGINYID